MKVLRIRTKIFLGMVAILAGFVATSVIVVDRLAMRMGERQINSDLLRGLGAYELFAQLRGDIVANQVRSIAQTPLLKAVMDISEVDYKTVYHTAHDLYEAIDANLMLLVDTRGRLLTDASRMEYSGSNMKGMAGVSEGLQGAAYDGIWNYRNELYQIALTPIVIDEQILGLLVLGDRLDAAMAAAMRQSTGKDVLILHDGAVVAQSWENLPRAVDAAELGALVELLRDPALAARPFRIALGGKERLAIAVPFTEIEGYVVLSRGLNELQKEIDLFELSMLGIGAAATLIAVLFSLWFSAWMSRPISALSKAAEEVGAGRLGRRVETFAADELGLLARTFNSMVERIAERTSDLEQEIAERRRAEAERTELEEQLRQSQKLEAIGMLAGGLAHDFNNLLTVVMGYSELLLEEMEEDNPQRQSIKEINRAGERCSNLVRQLLAFSRRQLLQPRVCALNELVDDMEKMLLRLIGKDIELKTDYNPDAGLVYIDPGQIEQVVMNLVVNARDAMPDGGRVLIETAPLVVDADDGVLPPDMRPGPYARVAVSDTGIGMDAQTREYIFEPFFTTVDRNRGTGLSLSTVYGIIKQSGGHIQVQSEPGLGTRFEVLLPQVSGQVEREARVRAAPELLRGSETILLVEDDVLVLNLMRQILRQYGYSVIEADNGHEGLQASARHEGAIELLITDVVMPQLGGPELAQQLKETRVGMKVLFISGYVDEAVFRRSKLEPGEVLMQKPFMPEALVGKVREILDG